MLDGAGVATKPCPNKRDNLVVDKLSAKAAKKYGFLCHGVNLTRATACRTYLDGEKGSSSTVLRPGHFDIASDFNNIKQLRAGFSWTLTDLCNALGFTMGMSEKTSGQLAPQKETIIEIAFATEAPVSFTNSDLANRWWPAAVQRIRDFSDTILPQFMFEATRIIENRDKIQVRDQATKVSEELAKKLKLRGFYDPKQPRLYATVDKPHIAARGLSFFLTDPEFKGLPQRDPEPDAEDTVDDAVQPSEMQTDSHSGPTICFIREELKMELGLKLTVGNAGCGRSPGQEGPGKNLKEFTAGSCGRKGKSEELQITSPEKR